MYKQKKIFKVLFLFIVFSSLLASVCLASAKPTSKETTKVPDKTQNSDTNSSTSKETTKVPDKTQNGDTNPSTSQETTKVPDKTQNDDTNPSTSQETIKEPDKSQDNKVKPSIPQEIAEAYDNIIKSEPLLIIIDKSEYKLHLLKEGQEIKSYDVAIGKNPGQKQRVGDMTTPTGEFQVDEIINSSYWTHDFHDGNGEIEGAYGPWFISLETGWNGIGIHGTHNPSSIRTMASEGCIRMNNNDVAELKKLIFTGTKVVVVE